MAQKIHADQLDVASLAADPTLLGAFSGSYRGAHVRQFTSFGGIPSSIATKMQFDQVQHDTDSIYNALAPTRLTVPAGVTRVQVFSHIESTSPPAGVYNSQAVLIKNNVTFPGGGKDLHNTNGTLNVIALSPFSMPLDVVGGDYFEVSVWQNSGILLNPSTQSVFGMIILE